MSRSMMLALIALCSGSLLAGAQEPAAAPPAEAAPAAAPEVAAPAGPRDIRQVQIQAWISETGEKGLRNIGVNLNFTRFVDGQETSGSLQQIRTSTFDPQSDFDRVTLPTPQAPENQLSQLPPADATAIRNQFNDTLRQPDDESSTLPGVQTRDGFGFTGSIVTNRGTIDSVFRSVERQSDIDIVSKPEVLVVDQGEAIVRAGGKVPYQNATANAYGAQQLEVVWEDVGVNLNIIPHILPNGSVKLTLKQLDVTDIERVENNRGIDLPVFAKRSQTGVVVVPDGQTLVIGGLSSRVVRRAARQVPIIGGLPLVGVPFRRRETEAAITHLLVFVSPTVVDLRDLNKKSRSALEFWQQRGDQWENANRIQEEINQMEHEL